MKRLYLLGYDIREPRRLRRVHAVAKRYGVPLQYSVFVARLTDGGLERLIRELKSEVDERRDDVRIYPIPVPTEVTLLGEQTLPEGVVLGDEGVRRLLMARESEAEVSAGDVECETE